MWRRVVFTWLWAGGWMLSAQTGTDADILLTRITAKIRDDFSRLPDYVCAQTVERSRRLASTTNFRPLDILRLDVALVGNREMYSWQGAERFEGKELADLVDRGIIGSGNFGLLARHVFLSQATQFTFRGEEVLGERRTVRFDYEVPQEHSSYRVRVPPRQAAVGFEGSIWVDAGTLDLTRLEVRAVDIPEQLGLAEASTVMNYMRATVGDTSALLPASSELRMITVGGEESRNVARFATCRRYQAESTLSFGEPPQHPQDGPKAPPAAVEVPASVILELSLAEDIDLESAAAGDRVRAVLLRPLRAADRVIVPEGATVRGHLLRLDKQTYPFEHYIAALQFQTLEFGDSRTTFTATLADVAPATGLIRQAKRLNPTFTTKRAPRMEILVGEQHPGQGIIHWDARHPHIRKGLKMRWQTMANP